MYNGASDLNGSNSEAVVLGATGDAGGRCCTCTIDFGTPGGEDYLTV